MIDGLDLHITVIIRNYRANISAESESKSDISDRDMTDMTALWWGVVLYRIVQQAAYRGVVPQNTTCLNALYGTRLYYTVLTVNL